MISFFVISLILLVSGFSPASAPATVPAEALGPVRYEVRYKLKGITTKVAEATISLENGTRDGNAVLHSHAVIRANSVFRLFMNAEYISDAYFTKDSQEPLYSLNPIRKGKNEGKFECIYDLQAKTVSSEYAPPSETPVVNTYPFDGLTMDLLSLLQYVRFHDIPVGRSLNMHLLMKGRSVAAVITNQGSDKEKFPGRPTERLFLKMNEMGLMENGSGNAITVWRSTDSAHQILGLETDLSSGTMSISIIE